MQELIEKLEKLISDTTMYSDDEYACGWFDAINACIHIAQSMETDELKKNL